MEVPASAVSYRDGRFMLREPWYSVVNEALTTADSVLDFLSSVGFDNEFLLSAVVVTIPTKAGKVLVSMYYILGLAISWLVSRLGRIVDLEAHGSATTKGTAKLTVK